MNNLTNYELDIIASHAAAIHMKVNEMVGEGMPLESAKTKALVDYNLRSIPPEILPYKLKDTIKLLIDHIGPEDLNKWDIQSFAKQTYEDAGTPDTWYNRLLWRWFGMTW